MPVPDGFAYTVRANGEVSVSHHGRHATVLRGRAAERLVARLAEVDADATQHLLARATGNYRRGNER